MYLNEFMLLVTWFVSIDQQEAGDSAYTQIGVLQKNKAVRIRRQPSNATGTHHTVKCYVGIQH